MDPIDTEIPGNPGAVEGGASWLSDTLKPLIKAAGDQVNTTRLAVAAGWDSVAGYEFHDQMCVAIRTIDAFEDSLADMADEFNDFASSLRRCQSDMAEARTEAETKGADG